MANVMLSSESSTDPSKPFKIRIQELRILYDVCILYWMVCESDDKKDNRGLSTNATICWKTRKLKWRTFVCWTHFDQIIIIHSIRDGAPVEQDADKLAQALDKFNAACDDVFKEVVSDCCERTALNELKLLIYVVASTKAETISKWWRRANTLWNASTIAHGGEYDASDWWFSTLFGNGRKSGMK